MSWNLFSCLQQRWIRRAWTLVFSHSRTVKLDPKNPSIQARFLGTFITVAGAVFVTLYKGPVIRKSSVLSHLEHHLFIFASTPEQWEIGGILLAGASFSVSVWSIIQVLFQWSVQPISMCEYFLFWRIYTDKSPSSLLDQMGTLKQYPQVMKVVSFYSLFGTLQCTLISLAIERDPSAWKLKLGTELLLIISTVRARLLSVSFLIALMNRNSMLSLWQAIFGGLIRTGVQIWCMRLKGPLYVTMFKPFGIIYASFFGISFFGNSICYGR